MRQHEEVIQRGAALRSIGDPVAFRVVAYFLKAITVEFLLHSPHTSGN
jgi:hypothetical protein